MLVQTGYGIIISEKDGVCISFQNQTPFLTTPDTRANTNMSIFVVFLQVVHNITLNRYNSDTLCKRHVCMLYVCMFDGCDYLSVVSCHARMGCQLFRRHSIYIKTVSSNVLAHVCFVHPIFRFWFLVTFVEEVTKIQKYYIIFVYILQGRMGKTGKTGKKITQLK